ncbi:MAG: Phosphoenolpyruvate carboxylase [Candidatus Roizmanbacteria bacterium GW2011_GWA2_37_7]|uniref:Phosphoenolpyruvate carboxylase n=1 Tax=Candidatus Roizmanbacteria bacterium GW2011_GWA2_37_7 TaxID=1618481 RepID=A0A0G0KB72_9BACT|nr:MAG: Phosphoenolpyruvate carboxylase [Candidatus Roizmanbacteria bacterium GW2011_GWA2_37_7]
MYHVCIIPFALENAKRSTQEEPRELYLSFKDLGATEYKWDWEGKLVDEAILERIFGEYFDYFQKEQIGKDKFITFRLPNPKVETEYRLGRAFMGILAASGLTKTLGLKNNPLFEVILPMTESAKEMYDIQDAFRQIAAIRHPLLKRGYEDIDHIELIPLFEDIDTISHSDEILQEYLERHIQGFDFKPQYIRPYVARSDPALNAGIVPTVLAIKIALSRYKRFEEKNEIPLYPMIGAASLPFRGGISPRTVDQFMNEYAGIRTTTIQSGFRYDYPKEEVIEAIAKLEKKLSSFDAQIISKNEEEKLRKIMTIFSQYYRSTIEKIAPLINQISKYIPKRRERVQHVGLFGYSRGVGDVKLPRAITFTSVLYSIGVPPELIGTGRGIHALSIIKKQNLMELLERYYINIRSDLLHAISYTNFEVLEALAKNTTGFDDILSDVTEIIKYLGSEVALTNDQKAHTKLTSQIYKGLNNGKDVTNLIEKAALVRRSLG